MVLGSIGNDAAKHLSYYILHISNTNKPLIISTQLQCYPVTRTLLLSLICPESLIKSLVKELV